MATYKVQSNGKAQSGLKKGDTVVTGGGTYKITGVNSDGSYQSTKVSNETTSTYKGTYTNSGGSSGGSSGGTKNSSSGSSGNKNYDVNMDYSALGRQQMGTGASWQDVLATYNARQAKAMGEQGLSQYINDDIQNEMLQYILNARGEEGKNQYENFEYEEEKPTYENKWTPAMQEMLDKILNREDFSYDALSDPLYQQYSAQYQREGDRAMRDTLAEAAAGAGGMNSYAITAAQQANDYYASQMADKIPELYQLAYQMYLQDKESMVQDFGLLQSMDDTQYNRYRDTVQDYYNDKNFAYGVYKDAITQGNWEKEFGYNQMINDRNFNYNASQDALNREQYNKEYADKLAQYNDAILREDEQLARETAREEVFALLELGQMPSADKLKAAGIDEAYASAYLAGVKAQLAKKSSGGSSSSSKKKVVVDDDDPEEGDNPKPQLNDGSVEGLGLLAPSEKFLEFLATQGALETDNKGNVYWAEGWNKDNYQEKIKKQGTNLAIDNLMNGLYKL